MNCAGVDFCTENHFLLLFLKVASRPVAFSCLDNRQEFSVCSWEYSVVLKTFDLFGTVRTDEETEPPNSTG